MADIQINENLLDKTLARLEESHKWSSRAISRLEAMIRTSNDYSLFRVDPLQYAADKGMAESESIDLFLHATKAGLFEMNWHLVCPVCAHVVESFPSLSHAHSDFRCSTCWAEGTVSMDDYIQVTFTVSPQIRDLTYHHPDRLPIEDFLARYSFARGIKSGPSNTYISEFWLAHTRVCEWMAPREIKRFEFDLVPGALHVASDITTTAMPVIFVNDGPPVGAQTLQLQLLDHKIVLADRPWEFREVLLDVATLKIQESSGLSTGRTTVTVENPTDKRRPIWLVNVPAGTGPVPLAFDPFLSGKRLLTHETFRSLFRFETTSAEGIGVKDITFLFTDLKGSTEMYDRIGDPQAFYLVRQHFEELRKVVIEYSGSIVKTIGDAVMATFMTPLEAVKAAVTMLEEIERFNRGVSTRLILKIGVHRGHSIVVTLNDRLDYFGQTVNIASRVQALADAGEICMTEDVYRYPGVNGALGDRAATAEHAALKGIGEQMDVYRIAGKKRTLP